MAECILPNSSRGHFVQNRTAALAEWREFGAAPEQFETALKSQALDEPTDPACPDRLPVRH